MNCGHCQNNLLLPPSLFALPICQLLLLLLLHGKRKVTNMQIDLKKDVDKCVGHSCEDTLDNQCCHYECKCR